MDEYEVTLKVKVKARGKPRYAIEQMVADWVWDCVYDAEDAIPAWESKDFETVEVQKVGLAKFTPAPRKVSS